MSSALVDNTHETRAFTLERPLAALRSPLTMTQRFAFAGVCLAVMLASCLLAGWTPIWFSIATVFLFAGPHNWFEARYILTRMPGRWGPLRMYFLTGIGGVFLLTAANAAIPYLVQWQSWSESTWLMLIAFWNTLLIGWITSLILLRSRQNPHRNWIWVVPVSCLLVAVNWLWPIGWSLALVYLHPLMALWFLDRELCKSHSAWQPVYRRCVALVPFCLAALWWNLAAAPNLPGTDLLTLQITQHAGEGVYSGVSTHFLVAAHTFLEMLHYGVWILAIPLLSIRMVPWKLDNVPLTKRSPVWRPILLGTIACGFAIVLILWTAFLADYPVTRNIYFTVAMLHVLAEVPFLLRLL